MDKKFKLEDMYKVWYWGYSKGSRTVINSELFLSLKQAARFCTYSNHRHSIIAVTDGKTVEFDEREGLQQIRDEIDRQNETEQEES